MSGGGGPLRVHQRKGVRGRWPLERGWNPWTGQVVRMGVPEGNDGRERRQGKSHISLGRVAGQSSNRRGASGRGG